MRGVSQRVIEEGRSHPFVEAIVRELRARQVAIVAKLQDAAGNVDNTDISRLCQLGGRAIQLGEILRLIETAESSEPT